MKKFVLIIVAFSVIIFSCENNNEITSVQNKPENSSLNKSNNKNEIKRYINFYPEQNTYDVEHHGYVDVTFIGDLYNIPELYDNYDSPHLRIYVEGLGFINDVGDFVRNNVYLPQAVTYSITGSHGEHYAYFELFVYDETAPRNWRRLEQSWAFYNLNITTTKTVSLLPTDPAGGTYLIDGQSVTSGSFTWPYGTEHTLVAPLKINGVLFTRWSDGTTNRTIEARVGTLFPPATLRALYINGGAD